MTREITECVRPPNDFPVMKKFSHGKPYVNIS